MAPTSGNLEFCCSLLRFLLCSSFLPGSRRKGGFFEETRELVRTWVRAIVRRVEEFRRVFVMADRQGPAATGIRVELSAYLSCPPTYLPTHLRGGIKNISRFFPNLANEYPLVEFDNSLASVGACYSYSAFIYRILSLRNSPRIPGQ